MLVERDIENITQMIKYVRIINELVRADLAWIIPVDNIQSTNFQPISLHNYMLISALLQDLPVSYIPKPRNKTDIMILLKFGQDINMTQLNLRDIDNFNNIVNHYNNTLKSISFLDFVAYKHSYL
jgi:hypothetical protein